MDQFIKRLCDFGHERRLRQVLLGNAVRIGEDQVPELWGSYTHCVRVLDLERHARPVRHPDTRSSTP